VILAGVAAVTLADTATVQLRDLSAHFYLEEGDVGRNRAEACCPKLHELNPAVNVAAHTAPLNEAFLKNFEVRCPRHDAPAACAACASQRGAHAPRPLRPRVAQPPARSRRVSRRVASALTPPASGRSLPQAVVFTDLPLADAVRFDAFCRSQSPPVAFLRGETRGVFASAFCDFGPAFTVLDTDGEAPRQGLVAGITPGNPTLVSCVDDERLEFQDGDLVTFSEVRGMTELNDGVPRRVSNVKAHSFMLEEDTTGYAPHVSGGMVLEEKQPKTLAFKPLAEALGAPGEMLLSDFAKMDRPLLLHAAFQALDAFRAKHGRFPTPGDGGDADALVAMAREVAAAAPADARHEALAADADKDASAAADKLLRTFASGSSGEISPLVALFGGLLGQEVIKACTGKFHPLFQWFHFDSVESLPALDDRGLPPAADVAPRNCRYDGAISVLGAPLVDKLGSLRVFLVGAGALGCEFIKGFACLGVACGAAGEVTLTDDDTIEKSNLSRQFLFRNTDIGKPKSSVAAAAAVKINPALRVRALQNRVSPETEGVFDDAFWGKLDVVVNALDNVNARLYVDMRCVYFGKPLLESGTLGTKANTQCVVPRLTENYGASRDPPEKQAPMCTVHSFPHNIDHCLTWARSEFEGLFSSAPLEGNAFLDKPAEYAAAARAAGDAQARENVERAVECLAAGRPGSFDDCVAWARLRFQDFFHDRVAQLIHTFPEDAATSTGAPFWSPPKRFPHPVIYHPEDESQLRTLLALATLRAEVYGVARPPWHGDLASLAAACGRVAVPTFVPRDGVAIETDPKATAKTPAAALAGDDESLIAAGLAKLEAARAALGEAFRVRPVVFEKDDDTNFHMDAISGMANMRARAYDVPEVDKLKAKLIAGRIIPAIATATALATGFVGLELLKAVQDKPVEAYRNTFANLALPLFAMAEPIPPKVTKHGELSWSLWDRWVLEGDLTVAELLAWFEAKGLAAYSVSCGQSLIYNNLFPKHKERLGRKVSEVVRDVAKLEVPPSRRHFDVVVACENEEGDDVDVPLVSIQFR
jgi:ubiquitin-activating enzyme E1